MRDEPLNPTKKALWAALQEAISIAYQALYGGQTPIKTSEVLATANANVTPFVTTIPIADGTSNRLTIIGNGNTAGGAATYVYEAQLIVKRIGSTITVVAEINSAGPGLCAGDEIGVAGYTFVGAAGVLTVNFAGKLATPILSQYEAWLISRTFL